MDAAISFKLNDQPITINSAITDGGVSTNTTVLEYLREQRNLSGSKEGCASGDCGACSAVLMDQSGEYIAINSCITLLASIAGKHLITVEHLKTLTEDNSLHPVQASMVDHHGSQCGFCTPGFVMSMFALYQQNTTTNRAQVIEALGGNLCRCTGYRPIIDATVKLFDPKHNQVKLSEPSQPLPKHTESFELKSNQQTYFSPTNIEALATHLEAHSDAVLVAGGTDLCLEITQQLKTFEHLVYTGRVTELLAISETDDLISFGSAVSYSKAKPVLLQYYPALQEIIERLGSLQIRNQGTLGGNVANASPIGDIPPILLALDAKLKLRCGDTSRDIAIQDYFLSYKETCLQTAEFIESIQVPKPTTETNAEQHFAVYKISKRHEDDISISCGAFKISLNNNIVTQVRIAFGGMAEIPKRAAHCEAALLDQAWNLSSIKDAQQALLNDYSPISDFRASADYRMLVSQNLLMRFYLESQSGEKIRVNQHA